jgi:ferritin-like protein
MNTSDARSRRKAPLDTPTDLGSNATKNLSGALNILLADMFALYMKTKNFHWHVSGAHFRDYHLLLDEQASQIYATTDAIAERVRKVGGTTLRSIGQIARLQRVKDNDASCAVGSRCGCLLTRCQAPVDQSPIGPLVSCSRSSPLRSGPEFRATCAPEAVYLRSN